MASLGPLSFSNFSPLQIDSGVSVGAWPPSQGIDESTNKGQGYCLAFYANRSGSTQVANWFKNVYGGVNPNVAQYYSQGQNASGYIDGPAQLNFAFSATMNYKGNQYPITFGQGHHGALDNWWITIQGGNASEYIGTDTNVTQYFVGNTSNVFIMTCGCTLYSSSYGFILQSTPFSPTIGAEPASSASS